MITTVLNHEPARIVQITDTHLGPSDTFELAGVNTYQNLCAVLAEIAAMEKRPDLMVVTGDIAADEDRRSYRLFDRALQTVEIPCICLPGNHDDQHALRDILLSNHSLFLHGWQLLFLNSAVAGQVGGHLVADELEFLATRLSSYPESHTLIFLHHPPVAIGSRWIDAQAIDNAESLFAELAGHAQVKALFTGHVHQEFHTRREQVSIYTTPATSVQFLEDSDRFALCDLAPGYREIDLFADGRIDTRIVRIQHDPAQVDMQSFGY